ncbi:MAG: hypothetical protein NC548_29395 [Lachnospiraceae bacterium]|nr:hypothetical protein [Lachnospiraceae bacterium]
MVKIDNDLQIPVVVSQAKSGKCDIYIPDMKITIHGEDFLEAWAEGVQKASAIYYYNVERNVKLVLKETYDSCHKYLGRGNCFVTFMPLTT